MTMTLDDDMNIMHVFPKTTGHPNSKTTGHPVCLAHCGGYTCVHCPFPFLDWERWPRPQTLAFSDACFKHQSTTGSSWWLVPLSLFIILGGSSQPITDCYLSNCVKTLVHNFMCLNWGCPMSTCYIYIIPFVIYQKHPTGWSMEKFRRRLGEKDDLSISSRPFLGSSYVYSVYIYYLYISLYIYIPCAYLT